MTLYVFFPVGVFYYFNVPGHFDQQVERKRVSIIHTHYVHSYQTIMSLFSKVEIFPKGNVSFSLTIDL